MVRQFGLRCGASKFTSVLETVKKVIRNKGTILPNPQDTVLDLLYGRWRSKTLSAGVNLGIFESIGHAPDSCRGRCPKARFGFCPVISAAQGARIVGIATRARRAGFCDHASWRTPAK